MLPELVFLCLLLPILTHAAENGTSGDDQCPPLYKRFSSKHTYCLPPNPTCDFVKKGGIAEAERQEILALHNELRSKVATGQEMEAGGLPPAANMLEMIWDDELAAVAQKLTETCKYDHDCPNCRRVQSFSVGQNIGLVTSTFLPSERADWRRFINNLYVEVAFFSTNFIKLYVAGPHDHTQYGHFTQMMWATTWRIGCGWSLFKENGLYKSYLACNYGPGGNLIEGEMYLEGPPCSACPKNSCCGDACDQYNLTAKYPGLCKVIQDFMSPDGPGPHDEGKHVFFCDFNHQPDCKMKFRGKPWMMVRTPGGNWLSNVLKAGENTTLVFSSPFDVRGKMCFRLLARTGPNVDGEPSTGRGKSTFESKYFTSVFHLHTEHVRNKQEFVVNNFRLKLPEGMTFRVQYSFDFSVPTESSPQFIEIKELSAKEC